MERWKTVSYVAAVLSLIAALIHVWAMPEHFGEWWGYGAFFLLVAVAQGLYGVALLRRPRASLFLLGVVGNLAVIGFYVVTRTAGIPFFGPRAGIAEEVGVLDLSATVTEVALIVALAGLVRFSWRAGAAGRIQGSGPVQMNEPGQGLSRRDFLRTAGIAGALGASGGALGLQATGALGGRRWCVGCSRESGGRTGGEDRDGPWRRGCRAAWGERGRGPFAVRPVRVLAGFLLGRGASGGW